MNPNHLFDCLDYTLCEWSVCVCSFACVVHSSMNNFSEAIYSSRPLCHVRSSFTQWQHGQFSQPINHILSCLMCYFIVSGIVVCVTKRSLLNNEHERTFDPILVKYFNIAQHVQLVSLPDVVYATQFHYFNGQSVLDFVTKPIGHSFLFSVWKPELSIFVSIPVDLSLNFVCLSLPFWFSAILTDSLAPNQHNLQVKFHVIPIRLRATWNVVINFDWFTILRLKF